MPEMLRQSLKALPFTFFDVETTGLSPAHGHRVCELALLRVDHTGIEQRFEMLIDPQCPMDPGAFAVNQISPDLLAGAPTFADVVETVEQIIQGSVLVAHNAPFDMAFLENEMLRLQRSPPRNFVIDTLRLSRRLMSRSSYSLRALASDLQLDSIPSHRAMQDVLALQELFSYLRHRLNDQDIDTLGDVLRFQRGLAPGQTEPTPPPLIGRALREGLLLRIIYRSKSKQEATERIIQPRELIYQKQGLYMLAYCHLRQDQRLFALSKIELMELAE
jgi:DNA polymerase-3 subunit epsilon